MTLKQYDSIYVELQKLVAENQQLKSVVTTLVKEVELLQNKTLVVTTLDQDIAKLKIDVAALRDEQEA